MSTALATILASIRVQDEAIVRAQLLAKIRILGRSPSDPMLALHRQERGSLRQLSILIELCDKYGIGEFKELLLHVRPMNADEISQAERRRIIIEDLDTFHSRTE